MTISEKFDVVLPKIIRVLWGAALFTLPVTSFRFFPFMGDGTLVRPLSFYPIALLLALLLFQWMRGRISLPRLCAGRQPSGFAALPRPPPAGKWREFQFRQQASERQRAGG